MTAEAMQQIIAAKNAEIAALKAQLAGRDARVRVLEAGVMRADTMLGSDSECDHMEARCILEALTSGKGEW